MFACTLYLDTSIFKTNRLRICRCKDRSGGLTYFDPLTTIHGYFVERCVWTLVQHTGYQDELLMMFNAKTQQLLGKAGKTLKICGSLADTAD